MTDKAKSSKEELEIIRKTYSKIGKVNRCLTYAKVILNILKYV